MCALVSGVWAETTVGTADQKSLDMVIYNNDRALVRDTRAVSMGAGQNDIAFADISDKLKLAAGAVEKEDRIDSTEYGTLDATITDKAYFRPEAKKSETPSAEQTTAEISPEQAVE